MGLAPVCVHAKRSCVVNSANKKSLRPKKSQATFLLASSALHICPRGLSRRTEIVLDIFYLFMPFVCSCVLFCLCARPLQMLPKELASPPIRRSAREEVTWLTLHSLAALTPPHSSVRSLGAHSVLHTALHSLHAFRCAHCSLLRCSHSLARRVQQR